MGGEHGKGRGGEGRGGQVKEVEGFDRRESGKGRGIFNRLYTAGTTQHLWSMQFSFKASNLLTLQWVCSVR